MLELLEQEGIQSEVEVRRLRDITIEPPARCSTRPGRATIPHGTTCKRSSRGCQLDPAESPRVPFAAHSSVGNSWVRSLSSSTQLISAVQADFRILRAILPVSRHGSPQLLPETQVPGSIPGSSPISSGKPCSKRATGRSSTAGTAAV